MAEEHPNYRVALVFDRARQAMLEYDWEHGEDGSIKAFNDALVQFEQEAWKRGWELANSLRHREMEELRDLLLQVTARVDGKDRGDGVIKYEVYPDPEVYNWQADA